MDELGFSPEEVSKLTGIWDATREHPKLRNIAAAAMRRLEQIDKEVQKNEQDRNSA